MQTHLNDHRSDFEKKWNKIAHLENQDHRMVSSRRLNFAFGQRYKKPWTRTGKIGWKNEDKTTNGGVESLHSVVNRLEQGVTTSTGKHNVSATTTVVTSSAAVSFTSVLGFLVVRMCGFRHVSN